MELSPRQIVLELDKHIVGQQAAKKAVAIALRNRMRRRRLPADVQAEINPKNIMMIGPTGVGKTEIARRLAKLVQAPFVKVEATKYTEVGYVGRDVESMVRELVENAVHMIRAEKLTEVEGRAAARVEERLLDALLPRKSTANSRNPLEMLFSNMTAQSQEVDEQENEPGDSRRARREDLRRRLRAGELENVLVQIEVEEKPAGMFDALAGAGMGDMGLNLQEMFGNFMPKRRKQRNVPVKQARSILLQEESLGLIDTEEITQLAIERAEQTGIIFIDEIDKIAGRSSHGGPDVSREGVQRDILPIVEGSTIVTKYGPIRTNYVLFIAAGAFHLSKPSDLIPELQGRFPIRVELESLSVEDLERILVEPHNSLLQQYQALLSTEDVELKLTSDAIQEIARIAYDLNSSALDIGARRLHTVLEKVMEEISFEPQPNAGGEVVVDAEYVRNRLHNIIKDEDLSRYVL